MRLDVLVVGDANPDLVLRGDVRPRFGQAEQLLSGADLVLGGSAAITACGCARLGLRTGLLARVGDDVFGAFIRDRLAEAGVAVLPLPAEPGTPTGLSVILSAPGDRAILTLPGTIPTLRPADVGDELLSAATQVHVASLFLQPRLAAGLADVFVRARKLGVRTSLDTNWDPSRDGGTRSATSWPYTDVFLPNAAELLAVTGGEEKPADRDRALEDAAAGLVAGGTTVVLKDGARGARAWWPGGTGRAPGLHGRRRRHHRGRRQFQRRIPGRAGTAAADRGRAGWAAAAGSLSTRAAGGTGAQATVEELAVSP